MDKLSNFYTNSTVTSFKERLENARHFENVLVDFDGRAYIRIMKKLTQTQDCMMNFPENKFDEICLNDELNKDFHLRYYIPKNVINTIGAKVKRIIIMFNGLNELDHFHFYDMLGEFFATNDIAAVLLPTPLNLNRRIESDWIYKYKSKDGFPFWPSSRADKGNELLFFYSFLKSHRELKYLIEKIKGEHKDQDKFDDFNFYKNYFGDGGNIEISLLGYSLGGLKAISYFAKDFIPFAESKRGDDLAIEKYKEIKQKLHCCITINSGPNLFEVDTTDIGIKRKDWIDLLGRVRDKIGEEKNKSLLEFGESARELINYYRFLYVNDKNEQSVMDTGHEKIRGILNNYLAISGGADPIVTTTQMQRIAPPFIDKNGNPVVVNGELKKMSINQFIIANGDHHPGMETSDWHEVLPMVEENILKFMNDCGSSHYKRKDITEKISHLLVKLNKINKIKQLEASPNKSNPVEMLRKKFCVEEPPNFSEKDMKIIIDGYNSQKDREMFMRYYYRSKAFFPHFHEVIKKILVKLPPN